MKSNEGALNKGAPTTAPAPSAGSAPKANQEISSLQKKCKS